jgi:ABC-2 type transport system permease protein
VPSVASPVLHNSAPQRLDPIGEIRDLISNGNLLYSLVWRDLTVRYKRSIVGFFWTMLNPLLLMIIFTIVFSALFRFAGVHHYEIYFLSEYLVFNFFMQTTTQSMTSLQWNGAMMKRVRVPKTVFSFSTTMSGFVNLVLSYVPLFLLMLVRDMPIRPTVLFLPVAFLIIAMFTVGVAWILSALAVFFEDVVHMWGVGVLALLYMTPIIYPIAIIPDKWLWLIRINPLTHLFKLARDPVYEGRLPEPHIFWASLAVALITMVAGWLVHQRMSREFHHYL